jgi:predicted RNase H-like HicB family nuclease
MADEFRYGVIIYWSDDDDTFIAEIPELPGCAADGKTYQETVTNAEVVMREWIETAQELGRSIPPPTGRSVYDQNLSGGGKGSVAKPECWVKS